MKSYYDRNAVEPRYDLGDKVLGGCLFWERTSGARVLYWLRQKEGLQF